MKKINPNVYLSAKTLPVRHRFTQYQNWKSTLELPITENITPLSNDNVDIYVLQQYADVEHMHLKYVHHSDESSIHETNTYNGLTTTII